MVEFAKHPLKLCPSPVAAVWEARYGGANWQFRPQWPASQQLGMVRWLIEDGDRSPTMASLAAQTNTAANAAASRLWDSITINAPSVCSAQLEANIPTLEVTGADADQAAALSLIGGVGQRSASGVTIRLNEHDPITPALQLLLVTARPLGGADAPYLSLAEPFARSAAHHGVPLECIYPPRRTRLANCLGEALARGSPCSMLVFDGHGLMASTGDPCIAFDSRLGPAYVNADEFVSALGQHPPELIVLAACQTARRPEGRSGNRAFAEAVAQKTGCEVVAMQYDITSAAAAAAAVGILDAILRGKTVAQAVSASREQMRALAPDNLSWSAPILYSHRELQFALPQVGAPPPPDGIMPHLELADIDLHLLRNTIHCIVGTPLVGKSHLLATFRWWAGLRADAEQPLLLRAADFATPGDLLAAACQGRSNLSMLLIDGAEVWRALPAPAWDPLFDWAGQRPVSPRRVVLTSRINLDIGEGRHFSTTVVVGLAGAAIRSTSEREAVCRQMFGVSCSDEPWLLALLLATRGEPQLVAWAAAEFQSGVEIRTLLWAFLFPDLQLAAQLGPVDAKVDQIEPLLGWSFGEDGRYFLASLAFDEAKWDSAEREALVRDYAARYCTMAEDGLAFPILGHWSWSPRYAAILRARFPMSRFSRDEAFRAAEWLRGIRMVFQISDNPQLLDEIAKLQDGPSAITHDKMALITRERRFWISHLSNLPLYITGAELAIRADHAKALADIVAGMSRVYLEFEAMAEARAWLDHWVVPIREMAARKIAGSDYALASVEEEIERHRLVSGEQAMQSTGYQRIARLAPRDSGNATDLAEQLRNVIAELAGAEGEAADRRIEDIVQALQFNIGAVAPMLIEDLKRVAGSAAKPAMLVRLELLAAYGHFQHGDIAAANAALERAFGIMNPRSAMDQYLVHIIASEIWSSTGDSRMFEVTQRSVQFARQLGNELAIGNAQLHLAAACAAQGDIDQAYRHCADAVSKLAPMALYHQAALLAFAKIQAMRGDFALAEEYRARVEVAAREQGNGILFLEALTLGPVYAYCLGDNVRAVRLAHDLIVEANADACGVVDPIGVASWILGEVALEGEDCEAARRFGQTALEKLRTEPIGGYRGHAGRVVARACFRLGLYQESCAAMEIAAAQLDSPNHSPSDRASPWLELETIAFMAERPDIAIFANDRVEALVGDQAERTSGQLTITAWGWAVLGDRERAIARARRALEYADEISEGSLTGLRQVIENWEDRDSWL